MKFAKGMGMKFQRVINAKKTGLAQRLTNCTPVETGGRWIVEKQGEGGQTEAVNGMKSGRCPRLFLVSGSELYFKSLFKKPIFETKVIILVDYCKGQKRTISLLL